MRKPITLFLVLLIFLSACKKDDTSKPSTEEIQLNQLATEYHLQKSNIKPTANMQNFNSVSEFSAFLANRSAALKTSASSMTLQLNNTSSKELSLKTLHGIGSSNLDEVDEDNFPWQVTDIDLATGAHYSVQITSAYWYDLGFPALTIMQWDWDGFTTVSNVATQLRSIGAGSGSIEYTQTQGYGTQNETGGTLYAAGVYTETYGFGGVMTYTQDFNFTLNGTYSSGVNTLVASISYQQINL